MLLYFVVLGLAFIDLFIFLQKMRGLLIASCVLLCVVAVMGQSPPTFGSYGMRKLSNSPRPPPTNTELYLLLFRGFRNPTRPTNQRPRVL